ncbi:MAG: homogentisate 1,2-dioxygenase, partial [Candidatus Neomarinimicrobiota bacterium]
VHLRTGTVQADPRHPLGRTPLLANEDLILSRQRLSRGFPFLVRNGQVDELWYVQSGGGSLGTQFGSLEIRDGDYVILPRGTIWEVHPSSPLDLFILETPHPIQIPKKYRSDSGQLLEQAPFCERDFRVPELAPPREEREVTLCIRLQDGFQWQTLDRHPFDLVGWDGTLYPWCFSIHDFEPITGRIHQPPPVHQTFEGTGFVVCSFVPRLFDYHPEAIPAPYAHSNVDSDEVLFYSAGQFMSRKGIDAMSLTLHPAGLPHGPHPGKVEESIGKKDTRELAVMVDTFRPLKLTTFGADLSDPDYPWSWLPEE